LLQGKPIQADLLIKFYLEEYQMKNLHLYGTVGCHLCDEARIIMHTFDGKYPFSIIEIDISDDDELLNKYGLTIPVLADTCSGRQLLWPFSHDQVEKFLNPERT